MPSACFAISYASRRLPQKAAFSTVPPSLRTTLRKVSSDGATVRSSRVGSRMTINSYGRMGTSSPPMVVYGHGLVRGKRVACVGNRLRLPDVGGAREIRVRRGAARDRFPEVSRTQPGRQPAGRRVGG